MPVSAIVATPGAANANAFCDVAFADQYHTDRPADAAAVAWLEGASADEKRAALIAMTRLLCAQYVWNGLAMSPTQALCWPRSGLYNRNGYLVDTATVPTEIQEATAAGAAQLLLDAAVDQASGETPQAQGLRALAVGDISLQFGDLADADTVPYAASELVPLAWGYVSGRSRMRPLVR